MRRLISILKSLDGAIAALELVVALAAFAGLLVLTTLRIFLRVEWFSRVTGTSSAAFWWATPLSLYLLLTATLLGASLALRSRRHIQIDIVTRGLPRRVKAGVGVAGGLVAAAILGVLCRATIYFVSTNWSQTSNLHGLSIGPIHSPKVGELQVVMPIALAVMAFRCVIAALEDLRGVVTGDLAYLAAYEHHEVVDPAALPPPPALEENGGAA